MTRALTPPPSVTDALPTTLGGGRFEVRRHLGTGGMGTVVEAFDRDHGARVALKTLYRFDPSSLLHLKNEFRSLQGLRHPNLVSLFEFVEDAGRWFVTMELVDGVSLLAHVRPHGHGMLPSGASETRRVALAADASQRAPMDVTDDPGLPVDPGEVDVQRLRAALPQLARGLCALHDAGKVHRDVKPSNILVERSGRAVLVDFGLAIDLDDPWRRARDRAGTRAYMAPEQAAARSIGPAADWYGVGVVLYQTLTGQLPFRGPDAARRRAEGTIRPVHELAPAAPADLAALCHDLLALDPAVRPDGREILRRLGGSSPPAPARRVSFVGRRHELTTLARALDDSRQRPVLVVVRGESGVGKSALVRHFAASDAMSDAGALVLAGRCYERELVPYKAFDGIVDALGDALAHMDPDARRASLPPDAMDLARVFPALRRVEGLDRNEDPPSLDPQERQARAFAALRALLASAARGRPVVLAVDDMQWADADSHRLLDDLLRPPAPPLVCVIMTARRGSPGAADVFDDLALRFDDVRPIDLGALPFEDARQLARAALVSPAAPDRSDAIARETGGHPLFVLTLARQPDRDASRRGELRLDDALWGNVEALDPTARRVLDLVAIAGAPLAADTLASAIGLDRATFGAVVRALSAAHLVRTTRALGVDRVEPYHDRVREAVVVRLAPAAVRRSHLDLAEALTLTTRSAHDAASLVRHLEGAGETARAARQAEIAAAQAQDALAFDLAAEMIRSALRLGRHEPATLHALRTRLAETLANAGRGADAAQAYQDAATSAPAGERLELRRHAADYWLRSGHIDRGLGILAGVLRDIDDGLPSQRAAVISTVVGRIRARFRGLAWTSTPEDQIPAGTLRRIDAYHAIGVSLALVDPARGGSFEGRALRLALDAGDSRRLAPILAMEAGYSSSSGSSGLARARRLMEEVRRIAAGGRDAYASALVPLMDGFLDYHGGLFTRAAAGLREVERLLRDRPGMYFERVFCHCFRLISLRYGGRIGEIERGFTDWVRGAERRGDLFSEAAIRFNLNGVWLARDAPDEARADLKRTRWSPPQGGYHMQHWYEQQSRFEIDLYTGDAERGLAEYRPVMAQLARSLVLRVRIHRAHVVWLLGRLLLAGPCARGDRRALSEALAAARRLGREDIPYAQVYSLLVRAAVAHRLGHGSECASALEQAAARAEAHDYPHLASAARMRLGAVLAGPRGEAALDRGRTWMIEQGIRAPERMLGVWAPGFDAGATRDAVRTGADACR